MRSRLTRYLLTMIFPSGLLCLIFVTSLYQEERALFRQNLEAAEALRLLAGARSLSGDVGMVAGDVRLMASLPRRSYQNLLMPASGVFWTTTWLRLL